MADVPTVVLKPRRAKPFFGKHPWVFEQAIGKCPKNLEPGASVRLVAEDERFIAYGLFNPNSKIRIRLYSWDEDQPVNGELVLQRLAQAIDFRHQTLGLDDPRGGCRLVFSESDGLSGLVVDRYADVLVVQFNSLAMHHRFEAAIVEGLAQLLSPRAIYRRTERGIREVEGLEVDDGPLLGEVPSEPLWMREDDLEWSVSIPTGQKTGAYLDQRDNRRAVACYAKGRDVLDVFCHGGGFAIRAAKAGARTAIGIDSSPGAIELANANAQRNGVDVAFVKEDAVTAMKRLQKEDHRFGVIVLDPPKFARSSGALPSALRGYEQINRLALELLEPDGLLVSCSCSGLVTRDLFQGMLAKVARESGHELAILEERGQAPDHPISVFCLETSYLKCVLARRT
ncbi:Ribosomal RNA large subunit methyltransferase I [Planctomycetes bacterium Pan216]|uniref:Ribosomal RNA large subunit methyltransferase I n=1 Tax=Kolteria novifilia TaxID=2527975 RepID=A0A518BCB7_9BACT|nr:Ribosomal RNA large subunit methyltransferase I [Planctomycetes bacterium Pan216]